jgi:hypothetical protein
LFSIERLTLFFYLKIFGKSAYPPNHPGGGVAFKVGKRLLANAIFKKGVAIFVFFIIILVELL